MDQLSIDSVAIDDLFLVDRPPSWLPSFSELTLPEDMSFSIDLFDETPVPVVFPLELLPDDLIGNILEFTNVRSRFLLASCNKHFQRLIFKRCWWIWPQGPKFSPTPTRSDRLYIEKPSKNDILIERGARSNRNPGNKVYRRIIQSKRQSYRSLYMAKKQQKTAMSYELVRYIASYVGRFVKKDRSKGQYYILSEKEARKKVSQLLRDKKELIWL